MIVTMLSLEDDTKNVGAALAALSTRVEIVTSLTALFAIASLPQCDAVIFDAVPEPFEDTLPLVARLRRHLPLVTLVVLGNTFDLHQRLELFAAGIDEFFCLPFSPTYIAARLSLIIKLRKAAPSATLEALQSGDLRLDQIRQQAFRAGRDLRLRRQEYLLLRFLFTHSGAPMNRDTIIKNVWGVTFEGHNNVVDVCIGSLRKKLDEGQSHKFIHTVRLLGYMFVHPPAGLDVPASNNRKSTLTSK